MLRHGHAVSSSLPVYVIWKANNIDSWLNADLKKFTYNSSHIIIGSGLDDYEAALDQHNWTIDAKLQMENRSCADDKVRRRLGGWPEWWHDFWGTTFGFCFSGNSQDIGYIISGSGSGWVNKWSVRSRSRFRTLFRPNLRRNTGRTTQMKAEVRRLLKSGIDITANTYEVLKVPTALTDAKITLVDDEPRIYLGATEFVIEVSGGLFCTEQEVTRLEPSRDLGFGQDWKDFVLVEMEVITSSGEVAWASSQHIPYRGILQNNWINSNSRA
ncbi:hypothetical protein PAAG_05153 [Paracoccidioides lutzii Pb01]|uniref:Uncharacterized protein n=1 Tax=Paracoccidioides lutzii (strain ATCC MYA-826 / Pb01) TaxID=502779 RepID=C1H310_PARBA|nr:hypothetical protein PAAG_05153 [Paracoccidioides lutzii Pb01]EEH34104.2 hypothetical protein PAAG_05153 [Paracoccidioides lutzii Pb01]